MHCCGGDSDHRPRERGARKRDRDRLQFSVTPSTTQAGGHPNVRISTVFSEPTGLKDVALHLAPGLTANPAAIPFCPRWRLANLCSVSSKAGSIRIVAVSYGFELPVTRAI